MIGSLTWNPNGSLGQLQITDPFNSANQQTCTYSHDDLARIASANCGSAASQTFTFDPFGNIDKSSRVPHLSRTSGKGGVPCSVPECSQHTNPSPLLRSCASCIPKAF